MWRKCSKQAKWSTASNAIQKSENRERTARFGKIESVMILTKWSQWNCDERSLIWIVEQIEVEKVGDSNYKSHFCFGEIEGKWQGCQIYHILPFRLLIVSSIFFHHDNFKRSCFYFFTIFLFDNLTRNPNWPVQVLFGAHRTSFSDSFFPLSLLPLTCQEYLTLLRTFLDIFFYKIFDSTSVISPI